LADDVLLNFPHSELSDVSDLVWDLNLSGVVLPEFNHIWLFDGDGEEGLVPLCHGELLLNSIWLLFVLSHSNLGGNDVRNLLDDGVVYSLSDFVGNLKVFFIRYLVVDSVRNLLSDNVWNFLGDCVGHFSAGGVRNLELDFKWHLS